MDATEQHACYRELLLTWSAKINLVGPEARRNLDAHIDEALFAGRILLPSGAVLDFGSGGGLPAVPMAIQHPDAEFHLVEADAKKWSFLKQVARVCRLRLVVHGDRLERLAGTLPRHFTLVTSRAVGYPERWLPLVEPLLMEGGRVALFAGSPDVPTVAGFAPDRVVSLPRGEGHSLVILVKVPRGTDE
jgi:16S rRNA (guanine527-N7)-methyltransferase